MHKTIKIRLCGTAALNLKKTFECGQCFRWNPDPRGGYSGVAGGFAAHIYECGGGIFLEGHGSEEFWRIYFDLGRGYDEARDVIISLGGYLESCAVFGDGIRILRQEPWEALCSFIISQCNNIPRIKRIVETLCETFGEPMAFFGGIRYSFPDAGRVGRLALPDLSILRCGYRASYILSAARAVADGTCELARLSGLERETVISELMKLPGVGRKVASCAALYGLGVSSGFPVDTWMKKALREHFPPDFDPDCLGEYAGLAQQYIFYYAREGGTSE